MEKPKKIKAKRLPGTDLLVVRDRERTPDRIAKQDLWIKTYEKLGNYDRTARETGIPECTHRLWMQTDIEYAARFRQCRENAINRMKDEAYRRAVDGVEKNVYQHGHKVGTVREYSDNLLMFLLKGACPEEFRDNYKAEPDKMTPVFDPDYSVLSTEEVEYLHAIAIKIRKRRRTQPGTEDKAQDPDSKLFQ